MSTALIYRACVKLYLILFITWYLLFNLDIHSSSREKSNFSGSDADIDAER